MKAVVNQFGINVLDTEAKRVFGKNYDGFIKSLTLRSPQKIGADKYIKNYKYRYVSGKRLLILPRGILRDLIETKHIKEITNMLPMNPKKINKFKISAELFPNQKLIIDYLMKNVFTPERSREGSACCVLNLRAGYGKTFVAAGLISELRVRTLFICPNQELQEQAENDLKICLPDACIKLTHGSKSNVESADIVITVINTAVNKDPQFFSDFGLIIYDEVHSYCKGKVWGEIFWNSHTTYNIGLSATTDDDKDGFDKFYHRQLGGVVYSADIPGFAPDSRGYFTGTVTKVDYVGHPEYTEFIMSDKTGKMDYPATINNIISDPYRNRLIIDEIMQLYNEDLGNQKKRYIFVFSEYRSHLDILSGLLSAELGNTADIVIAADLADKKSGKEESEENIVENLAKKYNVDGVVAKSLYDSACHFAKVEEDDENNIVDNAGVIADENKMILRGGQNKKEKTVKRELLGKSRIILTTYSYSSKGLSVPQMNSMVFASPRRSKFIQIVGRILRIGGDVDIPRRIIDIVDIRTGLKGQFNERAEAYKYYGFPVESRKSGWKMFEK